MLDRKSLDKCQGKNAKGVHFNVNDICRWAYINVKLYFFGFSPHPPDDNSRPLRSICLFIHRYIVSSILITFLIWNGLGLAHIHCTSISTSLCEFARGILCTSVHTCVPVGRGLMISSLRTVGRGHLKTLDIVSWAHINLKLLDVAVLIVSLRGRVTTFTKKMSVLITIDQALFWSAYRRISAHFPRISDPPGISTNLLRYWTYI